MNILKKSWIIGGMMFATVLVNAQPAEAPAHFEERAARHLEHLDEMLNLTDAQVAEIQKIQTAYAPKFKAIFEAGTHDREAARELMEAQRAEIDKVFTPEQAEKLKAFHAERGAKFGKGEKMNDDQRAALRTYLQENVLPVLLAQREKLTATMSKADNAEANRLIAEAKAVREQIHAALKTKKDRAELTETDKATLKPLHEKMRDLKAQADLLGAKYHEQIAALREEIKPQAEQWRKDAEASGLHHPHHPAPPAGEKPISEGVEPPHHRGHHGHRGHGLPMLHDDGAFILMSADILQAPDDLAIAAEISTPAVATTKVYPNPSNSQNTIRFETKTAGLVKIELRTKEGQFVRTVLEENKPAGVHELNVSLGELSDYVYVYTIQTPDGTESVKFVVKK